MLMLAVASCGGDARSSGSPANRDAGTPIGLGTEDASTSDGAIAVESDAANVHVTYVIPFVQTSGGLSDGLSINLSIGQGAAHEVIVDTGSEALIVPKSALGPAVQTPSPAQPFTYEYTSDGYILKGEVVTASVALGVGGTFKGGAASGLPVTTAMPVHVLESISCDSAYPDCKPPTDLSSFGVLGAGFGRDPSVTPASNALLQIAEVSSGRMRPGYIISDNPPQLTIGVPASTADFALVSLAPGASGDWASTSLPGCVHLPSWSLCGSILVDTGLDYAIVSIPQGGATPYDGGVVPSGAPITFDVPDDGSAMTCSSDLGASTPQSPTEVQFRHPPISTPFINTGRSVLALYDYLFDATAGQVGFRKAGP
jgi:hypothetical protein